MGFRFGIESEYALTQNGEVLSFKQLDAEELAEVIEALPSFGDEDAPYLWKGDLGIKDKRWYVEGDERFTADGRFDNLIPKGIEVRTRTSPTPEQNIAELQAQVDRLARELGAFGLELASVGYHPTSEPYSFDPPLNDWEVSMRQSAPEYAATDVTMLTYGPDINISSELYPGDEEMIRLGEKLTFYSPFIVPFSFSSPFREGRPWGGYSYRTYVRTGQRVAARVFVEEAPAEQPSPPLAHAAKYPYELGRIEFKSLDALITDELKVSMMYLLKGLLTDRSLARTAAVPDARLHQLAARHAFDDERIRGGASQILQAAADALPPAERKHLSPLWRMLLSRRTPAHDMLDEYRRSGRQFVPVS